jgi:hypothetical protein
LDVTFLKKPLKRLAAGVGVGGPLDESRGYSLQDRRPFALWVAMPHQTIKFLAVTVAIDLNQELQPRTIEIDNIFLNRFCLKKAYPNILRRFNWFHSSTSASGLRFRSSCESGFSFGS